MQIVWWLRVDCSFVCGSLVEVILTQRVSLLVVPILDLALYRSVGFNKFDHVIVRRQVKWGKQWLCNRALLGWPNALKLRRDAGELTSSADGQWFNNPGRLPWARVWAVSSPWCSRGEGDAVPPPLCSASEKRMRRSALWQRGRETHRLAAGGNAREAQSYGRRQAHTLALRDRPGREDRGAEKPRAHMGPSLQPAPDHGLVRERCRPKVADADPHKSHVFSIPLAYKTPRAQCTKSLITWVVIIPRQKLSMSSESSPPKWRILAGIKRSVSDATRTGWFIFPCGVKHEPHAALFMSHFDDWWQSDFTASWAVNLSAPSITLAVFMAATLVIT